MESFEFDPPSGYDGSIHDLVHYYTAQDTNCDS